MSKQDMHTRHLEYLLSHPYEVGVDNVIVAASEVRLYENGRLVAEPDIFFIQDCMNVVLGEYKCGRGNRNKAKQQLHIAQQYISARFGIVAQLKYVHGTKYHTEDITGDGK